MKSSHSFTVEISVQLYRALLWLYPAHHREEYGWLMAQSFRDRACDAIRRDGVVGILSCWLGTLFDLVVSAIQERREKRLIVSREPIASHHPVLLMLGGALFAAAAFSQLQPDDHYTFYGPYAVSMIGLPAGVMALASGLYGLRHWFKQAFGWIGQLGIQASIWGGGLGAACFLVLPLGEIIWRVMMLGMLLLFGGFILLGLDALRNRVLPRRAALPMLLSGITPFVLLPLDPVEVGPRYVSFAATLIVGGCWLLVGNYLRQTTKSILTPE